jgi:DNA-directed RNA polymerase specialized sigma24 family protein
MGTVRTYGAYLMIAFLNSPQASQMAGWQEGFLLLLPRIERYARRAFYNMRGEAKDDAVCEVVASCLCSYRRLFQRNELQRAFASTLVRYAVQLYYRGRRVGTSQCSRDVYARKTRRGSGIEMRSIGTPRGQRAAWMESLTDNHSTPIPEQAHFRIEFPRWLLAQTPRNRRIAETLSVGYTTAEVAREFRVSPGRVSQLRKKFCESWNEFNGEVSAC